MTIRKKADIDALGRKCDHTDWDNNFQDCIDAIAALANKVGTDQLNAANGVATLNAASKVLQTALNSDKLDNKTFAEISALFVLYSTKGAAGGVAELDETGVLKAAQRPLTGSDYQGAWNANTNTPAIPAAAGGNTGYFYKVSVAGTTNIDGETGWQVGDEIMSNGTIWERIPSYAAVVSVATKTGVVTLDIADVDALQAALDAKSKAIAETAENDFDMIILAGKYFKADLATMLNTPDGTGFAFIDVDVWGPNLRQIATLESNDSYSRVNNGAWSAWEKLNN